MTRPERSYVVFGFPSVHDALAAESALKSAGVAAIAIPSPKELGDLCGIALRISPADASRASAALASAGAVPSKQADIVDV